MTENERRILTILSRERPLSKKQLSVKGSMGWATVVKMVARLEEEGFLVQAGTAAREAGVLGKNAYVFDLSSQHPVTVGVDVSYNRTHLLLTNLKEEPLETASYKTPVRMNVAKFGSFVADAVRNLLNGDVSALAGVGVGMPARLIRGNHDIFNEAQECIAGLLSVPVAVDNNIRAYTLFKQRKLFSGDDFAMTTIRTGIGIGLNLCGMPYRGPDGLAGELGHLRVVPNGELCRCGRRGCLETVVNQNILYDRYRREVLKEPAARSSTGSEEELAAGLSDLFRRAVDGESVPLEIVAESADRFAYGLSALVLLLNMKEVHIAANFGTGGTLFADLVYRSLRDYVYERVPYSVHYEPIDPRGFVFGAAMLILRDYCDYAVTG